MGLLYISESIFRSICFELDVSSPSPQQFRVKDTQLVLDVVTKFHSETYVTTLCKRSDVLVGNKNF